MIHCILLLEKPALLLDPTMHGVQPKIFTCWKARTEVFTLQSLTARKCVHSSAVGQARLDPKASLGPTMPGLHPTATDHLDDRGCMVLGRDEGCRFGGAVARRPMRCRNRMLTFGFYSTVGVSQLLLQIYTTFRHGWIQRYPWLQSCPAWESARTALWPAAGLTGCLVDIGLAQTTVCAKPMSTRQPMFAPVLQFVSLEHVHIA